jgi:hypothetical protein
MPYHAQDDEEVEVIFLLKKIHINFNFIFFQRCMKTKTYSN